MLRNYMGIINLDEDERDIRSLTNFRPIATIPIAGRYRIIDFVMSNMVNAGLTHISVFSKKATRSLPDHLGNGKSWDLDRKIDGLFLFSHGILGGNANMDESHFGNNIESLNKAKYDYVILSSSYMICNADLEDIAEVHEKSGADITMVYQKVPCADRSFINCDVLQLDGKSRVINVSKNIGVDENANICAEIFVMKKKLLIEFMYMALREGRRGAFKKLIYENVLSYNVKGYELSGYLRCINSVESYYKANMEMLDLSIRGGLFKSGAPIYTKTKDSPPAQYIAGGVAKNSIVADGARISGEVVDSVISRSVVVEEGAVLTGCIVLQNAVIKKGARLTNVIVDKGVTIDENVVVQCPAEYPLVFEKKKYNGTR